MAVIKDDSISERQASDSEEVVTPLWRSPAQASKDCLVSPKNSRNYDSRSVIFSFLGQILIR